MKAMLVFSINLDSFPGEESSLGLGNLESWTQISVWPFASY